MFYVIYNSLFFLILLLYLYKKDKKISITNYLVAIWFISSVFSVFFYIDWGPFKRIELLPFIYLELCFIISIYPFFKFKTSSLNIIHVENPKLLELLLITLSLVSILPFIENLIHVISTYTSMNNQILAETYDNKMSTDFDFDKSITWLDPIAKICNSITLKFETLNLFLFFYYFTRQKKNKFILFGLLILVLNSIVFGLAMSGRASTVFFTLFFCFYLILFKDYIPKKILKKIILAGGVLVSLFITVLTVLTIARFENLDFTFFEMVNHYIGEGMVIFNDSMWNIKQHTQGDNSFALFKDIFGFDTFTNFLDRRNYWNEFKTGIDPIRFYTYIGSWYSDLGPIFTLFLITILSFLVRIITYKTKRISFISLYTFSSFYYIILCGFTIYPYTVYSASLNFMFGLFVCFIITIKFHGKKSTSYSILPSSISSHTRK